MKEYSQYILQKCIACDNISNSRNAFFALLDIKEKGSFIHTLSLFVANKQSQFEAWAKDEKDLTETISMDKSQYENETTVYSNNVISLQSVKHI